MSLKEGSKFPLEMKNLKLIPREPTSTTLCQEVSHPTQNLLKASMGPNGTIGKQGSKARPFNQIHSYCNHHSLKAKLLIVDGLLNNSRTSQDIMTQTDN